MKKRIVWIDILRVIGMIGVILIHIAGNTIDTLKLTGTPKIVYDIIHTSCYFALPLFVMVSGALLLNKDISYKEIIFKYIRRMLLVILIFGSIYAFMEEYYITKTISISILGRVVKRLITGELWAHMWYLYLMIALYLVTPILRKWIKNTDKNEQLWFLILLFLFTIFRGELNNIFGIQIAFYIPISTGFIFIYLLGNYLYNNELNNKIKTLLYILGIISFVSIILLTYFDKTNFLSYTSTLPIIVGSSIFYIFKNREIKSNNLAKLVVTLGECSFGIYIIHQLFINIIYKVIKIDFILNVPYLGMLCYLIVIFGLSFITIYLLRKVKIVRKYIL